MTQSETTPKDRFAEYRDSIDIMAEVVVEEIQADYDGSEPEVDYDIRMEADQYLANNADTADVLAILDHSENEPEDWEVYAEGKDDWEEVVQAMAYTVIVQDIYDELESQGYLNEYWRPTEKLTGVEQ
jgi:hypothetical protein